MCQCMDGWTGKRCKDQVCYITVCWVSTNATTVVHVTIWWEITCVNVRMDGLESAVKIRYVILLCVGCEPMLPQWYMSRHDGRLHVCKVLKWGLFRLPSYVANVTKVFAKFSG